ncbi:MAG TPA: adenosylcobinamide-phosphate synthase CbiB [Fibrobacteria bacterium]|nr:adenosylcobinamide-phosphate synthase CbiB [Fibrobacteria bacterium]HOX53164.1 adenosylcobinamide-phosphate synthase CbiB [Fibrobacteria bacterium]
MVVFIAFLMDLVFAEPPAAIHPVVWMGRLLKRFQGFLPRSPGRAFWAGAGFWILGAGFWGGLYGLLQWLTSGMGAGKVLAHALFLFPLFSFRFLWTEVAGVGEALETGLDEGRRKLSMLVSRDVESLSGTDVREAALETLAENLTDSVVAPLFWYALLGLPGAAVYRFANTADAMWGYRGEMEWKGKWAARADDVLNWIPARITCLLIWMGSFDLRALPAQAARTPSPNGGWTMGAMALSLGVRLGKPGIYLLNPEGADVDSDIFRRGLRKAAVAGTAGALLVAALAWRLGR